VVLDPVSADDEELVSIRDTQAYQKQKLVQPLRVGFALAAVDLLAPQPNLRKGGVLGLPRCPVSFRIVGLGWENVQKGLVASGLSFLWLTPRFDKLANKLPKRSCGLSAEQLNGVKDALCKE
jgi:hypothetical protein